MRAVGAILLFGIAALAGLMTSELLWRSPACREAIARFSGRGELQALVGGVGIYGEEVEAQIVGENLRRLSSEEAVMSAEIDREIALLRHQFGDEGAFAKTLEASGLSDALLHREVTDHLRGRRWIEKQIADAITVSDEECRQFYEQNREQFLQPQRFRASHLFLAAPEGTPPEVTDLKQKAIKVFAARIRKGEVLATLVAETSEDEATKQTGGDLGFFSAARLPPEFITAIETLRLGQISAPIRTHLGFHIVQLTDVKPPHHLSFDEARAEIQRQLLNDKRATAVRHVAERLAIADFLRSRGR